MEEAREALTGVDAWYSLGLHISSKGVLTDVLFYSPAYKANLGPDMKIVAVNGRAYTDALMHDAIRNSKTSQKPIELIVENTGYYSVVRSIITEANAIRIWSASSRSPTCWIRFCSLSRNAR